jgi:hypothetical protein
MQSGQVNQPDRPPLSDIVPKVPSEISAVLFPDLQSPVLTLSSDPATCGAMEEEEMSTNTSTKGEREKVVSRDQVKHQGG